LDRDGLNDLVDAFRRAHAAKKPIRVLLVDRPDRLSRADSIDTSELIAPMRRWGLRWIVTAERTYDLRDQMDRTLFQMVADHKSNPFLREHARNVLNGMLDTARQGYWAGRVPAGFILVKRAGEHGVRKKRQSGKLREHPEHGPIMREFPLQYLGGMSTFKLAEWLQERIPCPYSPSWTIGAIRGMLMNPIYLGIRRVGEQATGNHVRVRDGQVEFIDHDEEAGTSGPCQSNLRVEGVAPPLWSEQVFAAVQARLETGRGRNHRPDRPPLPLSGLGRCGHCGGRLVCCRSTPKPDYLFLDISCATRINHGKVGCADGGRGSSHNAVLASILKLLADQLLTAGAIERLTKQASAVVDQAVARSAEMRKALEQQVQANADQADRTRRRLGTCPDELLGDYEAELKRLRDERSGLETALREMDMEVQVAEDRKGDPARLAAWFDLGRRLVGRGVRFEGLEREDDGSFNVLLREMIAGFVVTWGPPGKNGRRHVKRVEVDLPPWLGALLGSSSNSTAKECIRLTVDW
jgi:hypothetical protein